VTAPDARIHVEARPADRAVRLTVSAPGRPDVRLDMDAAAARELVALTVLKVG
jgi:hypothetical protein